MHIWRHGTQRMNSPKMSAIRNAAMVISLSVLSLIARTEKRGIIEIDERWTADNSPYIITDDVLVTKQ